MSFSVGIVGLPNVGKSTLFKALTKKSVEIAPYPFTTIHPNFGMVAVPDARLEKIAEIIKPEKITPTIIEFVDIAGLVKGAHKGEGLGNQFLAHIRNCDAVLEVIRCFENENIENVLGEINPQKEIEILELELLMKDMETLKNARAKLENKKEKTNLRKIEILRKIETEVSQGKSVSEIQLNEEEKSEIQEYQLLSQKPVLYILNKNGKTKCELSNKNNLVLNLKDEAEFSELSEKEREELGAGLHLDSIIKSCYNMLNLIAFFTVAGGKETRAWTLKLGSSAPQAAGIVHSDFEKRFIKAEVIPWQKLVEAGNWKEAREKGWLQIVGKDYLVKDGDVIEFKI
jgi:hypothetical protein